MEHQKWNLLQTEGSDLVLGGDDTAGSPEHSAKYGSYSTIELEANCVIDGQLVQSNEWGVSSHVEKEGLSRSIQF